MPTTWYSVEEYSSLLEKTHIFRKTLNYIEMSYSQHDIQERTKDSSENYHYIPFPNDLFIDLMLNLKSYLHKTGECNTSNHKFLEIGCGIGTKMIVVYNIMHISLENVHGLEINSSLAEIARKITRMTVFNEDANSFKKYNDYNILYYYCPIEDREKEIRLEKYIESHMRHGAYLVYALKEDRTFLESGRFELITKLDSNNGIARKK